MPNRIIREAILSSEKVASLAWPDEVFYRRLQSIVDDYGRTEANPQLLRSRCYPLQTDAVRVADITRWMAACQKAGLILCYAVLDKQFLEVVNFGQQQRSASKFPPPPSLDSKCSQEPADEHLGVSVFGVVSEDVGVVGASAPPPPSSRKKSKASGMPDDFGISERVKAWAEDKGYDRLAEHLDAFRRKATAKGYTYASWDDAFMEAIREDWAKLRGRAFNGAAPPPDAIAHGDPESRSSIEAEGVAKGLGKWDEIREQWHVYKARVRGRNQGLDLNTLGAMAARRQEVH